MLCEHSSFKSLPHLYPNITSVFPLSTCLCRSHNVSCCLWNYRLLGEKIGTQLLHSSHEYPGPSHGWSIPGLSMGYFWPLPWGNPDPITTWGTPGHGWTFSKQIPHFAHTIPPLCSQCVWPMKWPQQKAKVYMQTVVCYGCKWIMIMNYH